MSKEIRFGPVNVDDYSLTDVFENVIHIPEEEDIAVVYGPNRSGKSTMIRAIENTMDLFTGIADSNGWKETDIGISPPYKMEFIDEFKIRENEINTNVHRPFDWEDKTLVELIEYFADYKHVSFDKRSLWSCNVLMLESGVSSPIPIDLQSEDWNHHRLSDDGKGEFVFIDLRGASIKMTSKLQVLAVDYPDNKDSVSVEIAGVEWPMFWEDGSPGWLKTDWDSGNKRPFNIDNGSMEEILHFSGFLVPLGVYHHFASNPEDRGATRALLNVIFDGNQFAADPAVRASLAKKDVPIEKRKKAELVAILRALDEVLSEEELFQERVVLPWVSQWRTRTTFQEGHLQSLSHIPGKISGNKKSLLDQIRPRFRNYIYHSLSSDATLFDSRSGVEWANRFVWEVESEIILPGKSEDESRKIIRAIFGFCSDSEESSARGDWSLDDPEASLDGGLRFPSSIEDEEKQKVFIALKELLPHRFSMWNSEKFFEGSNFKEFFSQNGFLVIYFCFLNRFRERNNLQWCEWPKLERVGPRDIPLQRDFPRCLRLDVDRVSGFDMDIAGKNGPLEGSSIVSKEASDGLYSKLSLFSRALPSSEDVDQITKSMKDLMAHVSSLAIKQKSKFWTVGAPQQFGPWDEAYCWPRDESDEQMCLREMLVGADSLREQGLIETHNGILHKIKSVYTEIKFQEANPNEGRFGMHYLLKKDVEWGDYEREEIDLIHEFRDTVNSLSCALAFIQAASEITGLRLQINNEGECSFHFDDDQHEGLSSGEKHIFAIIVPIATLVLEQWGRQGDILVMIDEPEVSLHVKWQRELYRSLDTILKKIRNIPGSSRIKVVLSTHSPEFIGSHEGGSQRFGAKEEEYEP